MPPIAFALQRGRWRRHGEGSIWRLNNRLEYLDYADDVYLLSHKFDEMQSKLRKMKSEEALCGLRINIPKTKAMKINMASIDNFTLQQQHIENLQFFCYLERIITTNGGCKEDVANCINKSRKVYDQVHPEWYSQHISRRTKLKMFNSCMKSIWSLTGRESISYICIYNKNFTWRFFLF